MFPRAGNPLNVGVQLRITHISENRFAPVAFEQSVQIIKLAAAVPGCPDEGVHLITQSQGADNLPGADNEWRKKHRVNQDQRSEVFWLAQRSSQSDDPSDRVTYSDRGSGLLLLEKAQEVICQWIPIHYFIRPGIRPKGALTH
jgi:hypothetical protein